MAPGVVEERGGFAEIGAVKPGEHLRSPHGARQVATDVQRYRQLQPVYDLTIEGVQTHTYYVLAGNTPVLVHNCGPTDADVDPNIVYRALAKVKTPRSG